MIDLKEKNENPLVSKNMKQGIFENDLIILDPTFNDNKNVTQNSQKYLQIIQLFRNLGNY